jgi:hypothetical protein
MLGGPTLSADWRVSYKRALAISYSLPPAPEGHNLYWSCYTIRRWVPRPELAHVRLLCMHVGFQPRRTKPYARKRPRVTRHVREWIPCTTYAGIQHDF